MDIKVIEDYLKHRGENKGNVNYFINLAYKVARLYIKQFPAEKIGFVDSKYSDTIPLMQLNLGLFDTEELTYLDFNKLTHEDDMELIAYIYSYAYLILESAARKAQEEARAGMFRNAYFEIIELAKEKNLGK